MSKRANRSERRSLISDILRETLVSSQKDLLAKLQSQGVQVNQATLSRDLRDMGVIKVPLPSGASRYQRPFSGGRTNKKHGEVLSEMVTRFERSLNILVLHTSPGHAAAAALALDHMQYPGILGTIAGDDTVLAVLDMARDDVEQIVDRLRQVIRNGGEY